MRFTFIHAADLHIDSPLATLGGKDAAVASRFREAGRQAVQALVAEAIQSQAAFLIIAGDVFDDDWKDMATGLFFVGQLRHLAKAGIPVFLIKGNHDAESSVTATLPDMPGITVFGSRKAHTHRLEALQVALHGRSYPHRVPPEGFVESYPAPLNGWLNIGLLHTGLEGGRGEHAPYAPCNVSQLAGFGYDYWALGHIHAPEIVSKTPWIVYPGNIQGRSVREAGPRGAMRVTVNNGRVETVEPIVLDKARWAHHFLDVAGFATLGEVEVAMDAAVVAVEAGAQGRPVALRLTLEGSSPLHLLLTARMDALLGEARLRATAIADDVWIEQVRLKTQAPPSARLMAEGDSLDIAALLEAAMLEPEFIASVEAAIALVAGKFPKNAPMDNAGSTGALLAQARDLLLARLAPGAQP